MLHITTQTTAHPPSPQKQTVQRFAQLLALVIAESLPNMEAYTREVTQAYIQSKTPLERPVYVRKPDKLGIYPLHVIRVVGLLHKIPESGLHLYLTYLAYHLEVLNIKRSKEDSCVLVYYDNGTLDRLVLL